MRVRMLCGVLVTAWLVVGLACPPGLLAQDRRELTAADVSPDASKPYEAFDGLRFDPAVPTPQSVLGHRIGERFTAHHDRVAYCRALAQVSDRVRMEVYGRTWQGRELVLLTISSPQNLARLDEILADNRALARPDALEPARRRAIIENNPAIIWYSFGVHGNEASCGEVSMQVAYTLAAATNPAVVEVLDRCVIVIDPQLNPDGQMRYLAWYQNAVGAKPDPDPIAYEHDEPWPSGRSNHYLFDLNRDWVWGVHPESRARLAAYRRYLPQLHLDYHEQGASSPYFFGQGDTPYNQNIPEQTKEWIELYGRENARAFDRLGLVYATAERFDYLYPGYGKVLPTYHGAIGLLLEKAGHGRAGLAIEVGEHYTLTLAERVRDHFVTAMNYAEVTARHRQEQLERFADFWAQAVQGAGPGPMAFAVSADNDPALLDKLWRFCQMHGIEVQELAESVTTDAFADYALGQPVEGLELPAGSWVIDARQPMGRLVRAMFERVTHVEDPDTYDITAWCLPMSFGLAAWWSDRPIEDALGRTLRPLQRFDRAPGRLTGSGTVGLLIDSSQHDFPVAVGHAVEHELFCRVLGDAVRIDGRTFARGSLLVHRVRNDAEAMERFVSDVLASGLDVHRVSEGFAEQGPHLGNNANPILRLPRVLLAFGPSTSSLSAGQHWHMLEQAYPFPHTRVNASDLGRIDLSETSVIVLPSMGGLSGSATERLRQWVRDGGALVVCDGAASWALREIAGAQPARESQEGKEEQPKPSEMTWKQRQDQAVERRVAGVMALARLDLTHPLTSGLVQQQDQSQDQPQDQPQDWMGMIVRGVPSLPVDDQAYVVARLDDQQPVVSGPVGEENLERMAGQPMVVHHRVGSGAVIVFADDPTIRGFHHAGMRLLMNAIVYGPTLSRF